MKNVVRTLLFSDQANTRLAMVVGCVASFMCFNAAAGNTYGPKAVANQSCQGRALLQPGTDGKFDALQVLDAGMVGKRFDRKPAVSLAATESMLVKYYGMRPSLRSLPVGSDRKAVETIAYMMDNGNVVAGQMALGALNPRNNLPPDMMRILSGYVNAVTEPTGEDQELIAAKEKVDKAIQMAEGMSPQPRAFARWLMKAAAWEDGVAHDAAMSGFCSSEPSANDLDLLKKALKVAKLNRGKG